jgi:hypothetical protein
VAHHPVVFCHGHFRLAVPHVFEGDRMTLILWALLLRSRKKQEEVIF